jgi:hypothetical protein
VLGELLLPSEMPALQTFLVLATLFPQRLGFDPAEAATFKLLPGTLKVWLVHQSLPRRMMHTPVVCACWCSMLQCTSQELLGEAAVKQPTLLWQLRITLVQMAEDQSSTMGQLLRNGLEASSAASTTVLQVLACECAV